MIYKELFRKTDIHYKHPIPIGGESTQAFEPVPTIKPILQLGFFQAQDIRVPVVSLSIAQTSILISPLRAIASLSNCTTSSFITPSQLKPFVQVTSKPLVSPSCFSGNENVKPNALCGRNDVLVVYELCLG
uniref:Uncharacterized protein n=1 Tax=Glossina austeni TaxID=7395 RepID=A0A1A9UHR4_GLOAU